MGGWVGGWTCSYLYESRLGFLHCVEVGQAREDISFSSSSSSSSSFEGHRFQAGLACMGR